MIRARTILLSWGVVLVGCADTLPEITDVEGSRTLAVVVSVASDPGRASPAPGESVHVEFVVADRGPRLARDFAMVACLPRESDLDVGLCGQSLPGTPIAGSTALDPASSPSFDLDVPPSDALDGATEILVHGALCADGPLKPGLPLLEFPDSFETDNPCADADDEGEFVVFRIPLEGTSPNQRPEIETILLDERPWTDDAPVSEPEAGCVGTGLPTLPADRVKRRITLSLTSDSREVFLDADGVEVTERPFVALHATDGDFEGAYAIFRDDAPREVVYRTRDDRAPRPVPETGRLVRFSFVVRDGRAGASVVTRALCVIP